MDNVKVSIRSNTLTLTIDLSAPGAPSSTGKTILLASTRGAATIPHPRIAGLKAALNVTIPNV